MHHVYITYANFYFCNNLKAVFLINSQWNIISYVEVHITSIFVVSLTSFCDFGRAAGLHLHIYRRFSKNILCFGLCSINCKFHHIIAWYQKFKIMIFLYHKMYFLISDIRQFYKWCRFLSLITKTVLPVSVKIIGSLKFLSNIFFKIFFIERNYECS